LTTYEGYVLDAHCLIWYIENSPRLGRNARTVMDDRDSSLFLPAMALAEACWFVEHGRSPIPSVSNLLEDLDRDPRIRLVPLDRAVLDIANTLVSVGEMHDRQIVATALYLARPETPMAILTLDENIRRSGVAPVVW
jgi:PIN domain nuclease of toxin-antitoxin system